MFSQQINLLDELKCRSIPIVIAITNKNSGEVNKLIQSGTDVNIHLPGGGKTPLHLAVEISDETILSLLIEANADVNAVTKRKIAPLHVAAQIGNAVIINRLLDAGAKIDVASYVGCTPLHEAAAKGHEDAVVTLIARNANPHLKEYKFNFTAAQLAEVLGKKRIVAVLYHLANESRESSTNIVRESSKLSSGAAAKPFISGLFPQPAKTKDKFFADYSKEAMQHKETGDFAATEACLLKAYESSKDIGQAFRRAAAGYGDNPAQYLSLMLELKLDIINSVGASGKTALHFAVEYKQPKNVKWLLEHGAETNIEDSNEKTAIDYVNEVTDPKIKVELLAIFNENVQSKNCSL